MVPAVENVSGIPVVDFSAFSLDKETRPEPDTENVKQLANNLYNAFSTVGFVYLKNHGIPKSEIDGIFTLMDEFFSLSKDVKRKYAKMDTSMPNGWDELEREGNSPDRPGDLKESLDIGHALEDSFKWPDEEMPKFKSGMQSFYNRLIQLGLRLLSAVAIGLGKDPDTFTPAFKHMGTCKGCTQLRLNYYPKIDEHINVKPQQIRCGEHTDYGAVSVLCQDSAGGLEIQTVNGEYVAAPPMEGAIIVNIADLLERWTADKLKSTYHRVLVPVDIMKKQARRSAVMFLDPDYDALIKCLDGQDKYPPILAGEYVKQRLAAGYKF